MKIASILENQTIEKRIAVTPEIAKKYISLGLEVLLSKNCHWKTTHSTTMTFAVKKNILNLDFGIFQKLLKRSIPRDKRLFEQLSKKGRTLITPIPSYSTHIEQEYLAPQRTWK